jgi:hypothetical protein
MERIHFSKGSAKGEIMAENQGDSTALAKLIETRRADKNIALNAGLENSLEGLLQLLDAPPELPGLLKIARNILAIMSPESGIPVSEFEKRYVSSWCIEIKWMLSHSKALARKLFAKKDERKSFLKARGDNPVHYQGATYHPLYCQLWETPANHEYIQGFRILQGHMMFAAFAVRRIVSGAEWLASEKHVQLTANHLYRTILPLQHLAQSADDVDGGSDCKELLKRIPTNCTREDFSNDLWKYRSEIPIIDRSLILDLGKIVSLLDWSIAGTYEPKPRRSSTQTSNATSSKTSGNPDENNVFSVVHFPGSNPAIVEPPAGGQNPDTDPEPESTYEVSTDNEEEDELEEAGFDTGSSVGSSGRLRLGITRYRRVKRDSKLQSEILAGGDHPENYLSSPSIDLAKNDRGVRLDAGGWQEMQNQYLPWSMNELADEELADAWLRLENHAKTGVPESVELFALMNTILWTGRMLKDVLPLEVLSGVGDPSGDICFQMPVASSTPSTAEWRVRALQVPHSEPLKSPIQKPGARLCVPVFTLPDYAGTEGVIRRHIEIQQKEWVGTRIQVFQGSIRDYQLRLKDRLSEQLDDQSLNQLERVTFQRIGCTLFQRIVDLTGGDLIAASFITGRDIKIAQVDRYYATPSIASLRKIYREAVMSIRDDLTALKCSLKENEVAESNTNNASVGSTLCPTSERLKFALSDIQKEIAKEPSGDEWHERLSGWVKRHNLYTLYSLLIVGWVVGFRAIKDPFIYPDEVDLVSGLTAFQDKGPADRCKSRLVRVPGLALAQIDAYYNYLLSSSFCFLSNMPKCPFFIDHDLQVLTVSRSSIELFLHEYLPLPANASRHFARTVWVEERLFSPEYVSGWLAHFYRGEEPWGKFSSFSFVEYCQFMEKKLPEILGDLGFLPLKYDGTKIAEYHPEIERFRRRKKARIKPLRNTKDSASSHQLPGYS